MSKIKKVIIPVAGYGTRFLPATKAIPKEMLPIIDKPAIQYIVEEAVASGIEDIILVTATSKKSIEDHFDNNIELETWLEKQGKQDRLEEIRKISKLANFVHIRQKGPYGNGTPVLCARHLIGNEPFAVMWGDDIFKSSEPVLKQMIKVYEKYSDPVITAVPVDDEGTNKYGILDVTEIENNIYQVKGLVEKPGPDKAPSRLASLGRYILTPDIFDILADTKIGKSGELWLADANNALSKKRPFYACKLDAKYYDLGSKLGWLQANIDYALSRPDIKDDFSKYLQSLK